MKVWLDPTPMPANGCGFVFNATGRSYRMTAEAAARSLRAASPGFEIDLYTDEPSSVADGVFDRVHLLERTWFRPKFEAIIRSRFSRTVCLDADIFILADISDIFVLLDRHDIAAAHVDQRNIPSATTFWRRPLPNSYPQINSGVLGVRKSQKTDAFFDTVQTVLTAEGLPQDQPVIRELLFDSDLRVAVLPGEYNMRDKILARYSGSKISAPRVLHRTRFQSATKRLGRVPTPDEIYGRRVMKHFRELVRADRQLSPGTTQKVISPLSRDPLTRLRTAFGI